MEEKRMSNNSLSTSDRLNLLSNNISVLEKKIEKFPESPKVPIWEINRRKAQATLSRLQKRAQFEFEFGR